MAINKRRVARERGITVMQVDMLRTSRAMTSAGIEALPETSLLRAIRRQDYPDSPRARLMFRLEQLYDSKGRPTEQPLVKALKEVDGLRARARRPSVAGIPSGGHVAPAALGMAPPPVAGLARPAWKALGPGNIGGRTYAILVHPAQHQTMWAGSAGGGIWRTDDGGQSWTPADDFMANLSVTCLMMDPNDANLIYAGTGEGFHNGDALRGGGIFRTTDGTHWSQIGSTAGAGWDIVNRIAISVDGTTMLVATNEGIRRSVDATRASWQTVLAAEVADVKFHPTDPTQAIAASLSSGMSWYSGDSGATWTPSTHAASWGGRVELCYARANPSVVFASVNIENGQIWRSANGGKTFTKRKSRNPDGDSANYLGDQGWYDNVIWADDPTNSDIVIVGGIDLWRSVDGGDDLVDISTWWDRRSAHADQHCIVSHPAYDGIANRAVFFGNDGGIYRADDAMTVGNDPGVPRISGWTELNNNYAVTQFFGAAGNLTTGIIVAGAQDNGTLAFDPNTGPENWTQIFGGDGGFCGADPQDPLTFYGEYVYLNIHRNSDGATTDDTAGNRYITGQFWNPAIRAWAWKAAPFLIPDAKTSSALFIAPFLLDPNNQNRILAGGQSLWRTNDAKTPNTPTGGPQWARIKPPSNDKISAICVTPGDSDRVWVGYGDGEISRSLNALAPTPSWSRIDGPGPQQIQAGRYCHRIVVSSHDPDVVFVTFGGFSASNVWRTDDGGATWKDIASNLPKAPVHALAIHPDHANSLYIGSEVGVFASDDLGGTWSPTNEGPANVSVDDLFWMDRKLICVTHGRGLFEIDLSLAVA